MGTALLGGMIARGLPREQILIQDPSLTPDAAAFLASHGLAASDEIESCSAPPSAILVAVKPQVMDAVFPKLARLAGPETVVISIAAGRDLKSFEAHLPAGRAVVRAMPNTPAAIGRGMTVCVANSAATPAQRALTDSILSTVGDVAWLDDETLMDAVTAVSGSGPAYVFLLAEAMAKAGVAAGLDAKLAERLANATVAGSGDLLRQAGLPAATLRQNVTSPGGTTAAALSVLMAEHGMTDLMNKAVAAAVLRGKELSKGN